MKNKSSHLSTAETNLFLSRIYHEAPDDIMEMIVQNSSDIDHRRLGQGGMNALRLVSKRLRRLVESCVTRLTFLAGVHGPETFPATMKRFKRIKWIVCWNLNLKTLEGCPTGLKGLDIGYSRISSLEPLTGCTELEILIMHSTCASDLNPLSSCARLRELKMRNNKCISDLSPLASCSRQLKKLDILGSSRVSDLSPLSSMHLLEDLNIMGCRGVNSLDPLSGLTNLRKLICIGICLQTSLLPLASCTGLEELTCSPNSVGLDKLKNELPGLRVLSDCKRY